MANQEGKFFESDDIPICSVCDVVCLDLSSLPTCSHPVCPNCLVAMASLHTSETTTNCKTCAEEERQKASVENPRGTTEIRLDSATSGKHGRQAMKTPLRVDINTAQSLSTDEVTIQGTSDTNTEDVRVTHAWSLDNPEPNQKRQEDLPDTPQEEASGDVFQATQLDHVQFADIKRRRNSLPVVMIAAGQAKLRRNSLPSVIIVPGLMGLSLKEDSSRTLAENVDKIREALSVATKHRHCATCLLAKKSTVPQLKCVDCDSSFCEKCSTEHKNIPTNSTHVMAPVEQRLRRSSVVNPRAGGMGSSSRGQGPLCLTHQGAQLGMYCRNCEVLLCRECVVDRHLDCPGVVSAQDYAAEEREAVRLSQILRFFSEQRQEADDTTAALTAKKRKLKEETRRCFSMLMKSCMDVEKGLLEDLEMSVTDHTDLLTRHSSAWLNLQECMQQLLDVTDVLHFLPTPDFLPLSVACKSSLSHALREGEMLATEAPAHMIVNLSLKPSLQDTVVSCVQEMGSTALTVTTHSALILRKMASTSYSSLKDTGEPHITSMILLSHTSLLAADFNNSCLKLFHREKNGHEWFLVEVLPLKFRPYSLTQLLQKRRPETSESEKVSLTASESDDSSNRCDVISEVEEEDGYTAGSSREQPADCPVDEEIPADCPDSEETDDALEAQVAVTSPSSGCFIVSVPLTGEDKMQVVTTISVEEGWWGITAIDENTLAVVTVESGHSHVSMMDTENNTRWLLPLDSADNSPLLQSPRHILATSPTSLVLCDTTQGAVLRVGTDGAVLFTYTGHGTQQLCHPEGACVDSYGDVYVTDPEDCSVTVLDQGGRLRRKTSCQQSDLVFPSAVCVDGNGCLYVGNEGGKVLTVFDMIHAD
ncbi:hypothetical protein ACOMHN_005105 [Nucella lapillus]